MMFFYNLIFFRGGNDKEDMVKLNVFLVPKSFKYRNIDIFVRAKVVSLFGLVSLFGVSLL